MRRLTLLLLCAIAVLPAAAQTTLNGAGATFPYPMYSKWFSEYHKLHSDIQINYQSIGSGGGIRQVIAGTVDFGASDGPMTDDQLKEAKQKFFIFLRSWERTFLPITSPSQRGIKVHARSVGGNLPGQDYEVE